MRERPIKEASVRPRADCRRANVGPGTANMPHGSDRVSTASNPAALHDVCFLTARTLVRVDVLHELETGDEKVDETRRVFSVGMFCLLLVANERKKLTRICQFDLGFVAVHRQPRVLEAPSGSHRDGRPASASATKITIGLPRRSDADHFAAVRPEVRSTLPRSRRLLVSSSGICSLRPSAFRHDGPSPGRERLEWMSEYMM
jgi:hypothetical protein